MPAYQRYSTNTAPQVKTPDLGPMLVGSVCAGAMFTLWNYARRLPPYRQFGTLALGGAAISTGQQLVRNAVKSATR